MSVTEKIIFSLKILECLRTYFTFSDVILVFEKLFTSVKAELEFKQDSCLSLTIYSRYIKSIMNLQERENCSLSLRKAEFLSPTKQTAPIVQYKAIHGQCI